MKKIIIGFVFGALLASGMTVYADSALGKKVDGTFPLKINGTYASNNVIVIEGTSYLPVRTSGGLLGFDVNFANNEVILNSKPVKETKYSTVEYRVQNNVSGLRVNERDPATTITVNGTIYVSISTFAPIATLIENPNKVSFKINGTDIPIIFYDGYLSGTDGFLYADHGYVNPEALGIKAEVINGELQFN